MRSWRMLLALAAAVAQVGHPLETRGEDVRRWRDLNEGRIREIAAMLSAAPRGLGPPIADREVWATVATNRGLAGIVREAERVMAMPMPPWDDELYLDYSRTGRRRPGEQMIAARHRRLAPLVWAEAVEARGRFVEAIAATLREYVREPTWTLPAHDASLRSFRGDAYNVDLAAATTAFEVGQALWMLGERLDPVVRSEVTAAIERRVFEPFRTTLRTGRGLTWVHATHNWNAVCMAGTVGAALAVLSNREERAVFAAAAEHYSRNFLAGFGRDGYCSEGIGYWNYGFGHFALLRETLWQATEGRLDLFLDPRVREAARYGVRIEIVDGQFPTIADCPPGTRPSASLLRYCSLTLGLGLSEQERAWRPADQSPRSLAMAAMEIFPSSLRGVRPAGTSAEQLGLRSWFDEAGVLVCRSPQGVTPRWGAAIKGGHNAEHHNHNDVGSWTLVLNGCVIAGDPGGPHTYTARTFSSERYAMRLFSSYGHPVPRVAGRNQKGGRTAAARILRTAFSDERDVIEMDITAAYDVPGLRSLVRTFEFVRGPNAALVITDAWASDAPLDFETAITTRSAWRCDGPLALTLDAGERRSVAVTIEAPENRIEISSETIEEDCVPFTRIALRTVRPFPQGIVVVRCSPKLTE